MTRTERLEYQRLRRKETNNSDTKKYEKSKKGFLMRLYRNMKSRITGIQKQKAHLYVGKDLLQKEEFYKWASNHNEFHKLFDVYEKSGYDRKLCPTVDRINSDEGYNIPNMEWVTHSENSRRGTLSKCQKRT